MCAKIVLSRLPLSHRFWTNLGVFRHGKMETPRYALDVFLKHFKAVERHSELHGPFTCLELGPGESLNSALIARAFGAREVFLIDVGRFVDYSAADSEQMIEYLKQQANKRVSGVRTENIDEYLASLNSHYLCDGIETLESLPDDYFDFAWSQAVLEHIRRNEFGPMLRQLHRVMKKGAFCSHRIDLKDHMGGGLNSLRFSERFWESSFIASSGFYTNRLRASEIMALVDQAGFRVVDRVDITWDRLPVDRKRLHRAFQECDEADLRISGMDLVLEAV